MHRRPEVYLHPLANTVPNQYISIAQNASDSSPSVPISCKTPSAAPSVVSVRPNMPWQYYLNRPLDGYPVGWHDYSANASNILSAWILTSRTDSEESRPQVFTIHSGAFRYEVDILASTQTNLSTGTCRPIRYQEDEQPPVKKRKTESHATAISAIPGTATLNLESLFEGACGSAWLSHLAPIISILPDAHRFLGPNRVINILPPRDLTFQALKPNAPADWRVVILGKHPVSLST